MAFDSQFRNNVLDFNFTFLVQQLCAIVRINLAQLLPLLHPWLGSLGSLMWFSQGWVITGPNQKCIRRCYNENVLQAVRSCTVVLVSGCFFLCGHEQPDEIRRDEVTVDASLGASSVTKLSSGVLDFKIWSCFLHIMNINVQQKPGPLARWEKMGVEHCRKSQSCLEDFSLLPGRRWCCPHSGKAFCPQENM